MGDPAMSDPAPASDQYTGLRATALSFIDAQRMHPQLPSLMDLAALRSATAPSYTHTFGPQYSVAQTPHLRGQFGIDDLVAHLRAMVPRLEGWEIAVQSVAVDEAARCVVVRALYGMRVRGEVVANEIVWWLEMEEGGGEEGLSEERGWRVRRSIEMLDFEAAGRIRELMMVEGEGAAAVVE